MHSAKRIAVTLTSSSVSHHFSSQYNQKSRVALVVLNVCVHHREIKALDTNSNTVLVIQLLHLDGRPDETFPLYFLVNEPLTKEHLLFNS